MGQGTLRECRGDAVCPDGAKALLCGAPDFGGFTGESALRGGLPFRKGWQARREDGGWGSAVGKGWIYMSYAGHAVLWVKTRPFHASPPAAKTVLQPLPRPPYSPAVPRGERRALPAPAQGTSPLGIPFWGTAVIFPLPPSPKTPQAASPCSWACRRLRPLPPRKKRKEAPMPPTRGAWARRPRAEGAGRPHCGHSRIFVTTPEPTVRPPSRMAKRRPSSHAIGVISVISMSMLSPGITISTPSGSLMLPVTSVVRK